MVASSASRSMATKSRPAQLEQLGRRARLLLGLLLAHLSMGESWAEPSKWPSCCCCRLCVCCSPAALAQKAKLEAAFSHWDRFSSSDELPWPDEDNKWWPLELENGAPLAV